MDYLAKAREVLRIEIDGIQKIADELDDSFIKLVDMCYDTLQQNGKLILSGIGKSGQIAQKLASTLSSTGSRAVFLHPVEALHGDLGIIHESDIYIAFSYSGETTELLTTIPAVKRLGVKIAAITGIRGSSLAQTADLSVCAPVEQEACPFNLAPTTTTTATMALGDALAMVLMEKTKFCIENYGLLHPGGAIGRTVTLRVSEIMRCGERLAIIKPETIVSDAVIAMCDTKGGTCLISDDGKSLLGIFTTGDLKRGISKNSDILNSAVQDLMVKNPSTILENAMAVDLLKILESKSINAIPVLNEQGEIAGVVDIQDLPKFKVI